MRSTALLLLVVATEIMFHGIPSHNLAIAQAPAASPPAPPSHPRPVSEPPPQIPGHTHYLDFKNGFREHKFGDALSSFNGLQLQKDWGKIKIYGMNGDNFSLGTATVASISYFFVDGKFAAVSLHADKENSQGLFQLFQAAFGPGQRPDPYLPRYYWAGRVAKAHFFDDDSSDHGSSGWIANIALQNILDKEIADLTKEAAAQL